MLYLACAAGLINEQWLNHLHFIESKVIVRKGEGHDSQGPFF
jgi:hypothetical protein